MQNRIIREKELGSGRLYVTVSGSRYMLAECETRIEVYETRREIPFQSGSFIMRSGGVSLVICGEMDTMRKITPEYLESIEGFDLDIETPLPNGDLKIVTLGGLIPKEIDLNGDWVFDATGHLPKIRELFPDVAFS